ncbi:MAG TPA: DUF2798 domain-containing protein [Burkholderiaceae bacterium]|jgi:hypothetical protein|nr:DUF2798 domain-containing protein [Burkholderiaceae bacterium]
MPRISTKRAPILFAILMACVMTFIVTCLVTLVNTGLGNGFLLRWMRAFVLAWPVASICIMTFGNRVRRIVSVLTSP